MGRDGGEGRGGISWVGVGGGGRDGGKKKERGEAGRRVEVLI